MHHLFDLTLTWYVRERKPTISKYREAVPLLGNGNVGARLIKSFDHFFLDTQFIHVVSVANPEKVPLTQRITYDLYTQAVAAIPKHWETKLVSLYSHVYVLKSFRMMVMYV
jgi:hypothetical protein